MEKEFFDYLCGQNWADQFIVESDNNGLDFAWLAGRCDPWQSIINAFNWIQSPQGLVWGTRHAKMVAQRHVPCNARLLLR